MEFYRNFIAYGITHSMSERRRMSGRRTFSAGQRPLAQPSFLYLLPRASEMKQILCFDWLCEKTFARYKATKTEDLPEASESRSS